MQRGERMMYETISPLTLNKLSSAASLSLVPLLLWSCPRYTSLMERYREGEMEGEMEGETGDGGESG